MISFLVCLVAMAVGPMLSWKRGDLSGALQRLWITLAVEVIALFVVLLIMGLFYQGGGLDP